MFALYDHAEPVAAGTVSLYFRPEQPAAYTAGQFTELYLPHVGADARGERRWFTLSSSPTEPLLAITTRLGGAEDSSYKRTLHSLKPGQRVHLADPMGDFVLPKLATIPLVYVAAGLGITPVRSMLTYLADTGEQRTVRLLYATRRAAEAAFLPQLSRSVNGLRLTHLISQPDSPDSPGHTTTTALPGSQHRKPGWQTETGRVTPARVLQLAGGLAEPYIYLSGPEPMVETLYKALTAAGVPNERLLTDYFPGYAQF